MRPVQFAYPVALLLLVLIPWLWYLWTRPARRTALRFSSVAWLRTAAGAGGPSARLALPILRSVAIFALVIAAARPQRQDASVRIFAEGIAIQLVIDTSGSMSDIDLSPPGQRLTRLDVVKEIVRRFVNGGEGLPGRPNDIVGLVRFAGYADSVCPLTLDHVALDGVLEKLHIVRERAEDGTAIGDGLALATERLKDLQRTVGSGEQIKIRSRVVILLTDGENNRGMISPQQAGDLAATCGVKVYTIMAGTGEQTLLGRLPADDRALRSIAETTGGKHFRATDPKSLEGVYREIDQLERTRVEERSSTVWDELSRPWLLAAFIALSLQTVLEATWLRKIP
jgi:Ca-activated chloride channel family protein